MIDRSHYENTPMRSTEMFFWGVVKIKNFTGKKKDIFLIFAQSIDFGYTLEPPRRGSSGSSNTYPQSMFLSKNKKNRYTAVFLYKSGV